MAPKKNKPVDMPHCRQCPENAFEMAFLAKANFSAARYMAICHALNVVLQPEFPSEKISESQFISRANVQSVKFSPVDNCPCLERLRKEGVIPWYSATIDFSPKR